MVTITFHVDGMSCGHCASTISRAIAAVDKAARLDIDIARKLVRVTSSESAAELAEALRDAGYPPRVSAAERGQAASSGCGCGCGSRKTAAADSRRDAAAASCPSCG
ncbi:heavy-metal-associated domain-containing protein [Ramlibacter sp. AN1015]|uniref:heavy-metal-associated domain-containing protein n=1 Tax=Ramlibacter sp. AN1015 TaxID=3133428 RepID=UPI0030C16839